MRKIYLEIGANRGNYVPDEIMDSKDYVIHAFEPNPILKKNLLWYVNHSEHKNYIYHEKLVWIENCRKTLYLGNHWPRQGSSVFKKKHVFLDKYLIDCEAIDFSQWVLDNFSIDDYIEMNMDIEGSEYYVLDKMIDDGSLDYVDKLTLEFHASKIFDKEIQKRFYKITKKIKKRISELGINCHYHGR